jgi:ABC-type proline/glycine betaine transport system permease subunit
MTLKVKSISMRFLKAAVSGMFSALGLITIAMPSNWTEVPALLSMIALACLYGAVTGVIMAGQKWYSWRD